MDPSTHPPTRRPRRRTPRLRRVLLALLSTVLAVATLAGVVVLGAVVTTRGTQQPAPHRPVGDPSASPSGTGHDGRLVVAFVAGTAGTVASDLLAPYDVFASSPAFSTYVVSDTAQPVPLEAAPAVVPTHTYADVDADARLRPDLVVVPGLTRPDGSTEAPLRRWVAQQHARGARVLSVCSGALVVAPTGMLDGRRATSHWSRISALEASRPAVHWLRGVRYVEDGNVTTTGAVTSGVPAALHLVAELAGPAEAQRVADLHPELGWTPAEGTAIREDHFVPGDWPVGLDYVMPWFRPTVGVALRDGVDEIDATAAFEVYGQSAAARTVALADTGTVRTRHGLVLLTTRRSRAPHLSRVVVPGGGFTAALQDLADHTDAATTTATAKMIGYPTTGLHLGSRYRLSRPLLLAVTALALALLVGRTPFWLARRRRGGAIGTGDSDGTRPAEGSASAAAPRLGA